MVLNIADADVARVLHYKDLIPAMERALMALSAGAVDQPLRNMLAIELEQRFLAVMPVAIAGAMGAKLVSIYPKNAGSDFPTHLAVIVLMDPETGAPLAFLDGGLITEMRTAALSAAVTRRLAPDGAHVLALLGSGVQAGAHLEALREIGDFDEVRVWSRSAEHAQRFAAAHGAQAMELETAVRGADVVVVATSAKEPVLRGAWLKPGAHVNSVGAPRPNWRELDNDVMANLLVVDSYAAAPEESGDVKLTGAVASCEAGELFSGLKHVDRNVTTVFKSVGLAVEDIVAARLVYDLIRAGG